MLHEVRGRRTETRFPVSINLLTEITIFGGSVGREKSDTSASESQRGGRVICRKDRSWRVSVKGRAAGGRERDRESKNGGGGPRARRGKHGVVPRPPRDPSTLNDRSTTIDPSLDIARRGPIHQFFHEERCRATQRGVRQRTIARIDRRIEKDVDLMTSFSKIRKAETRRV